ncbi:S-layer homology domain-containing protein [Priestia koreensis]|uniref:S-layer homology domain-containing protein n=2 Tax=Priestia koreensis TaxID=284581 RepID=UPI00301601BD
MAYQPKSYRKFIATAATATMVAGAVAPLATFAAETSFKDATGIYKTPVEYLVEKGFVNGVSKDEFGVSAKVKRGDAAVILSKALGLYATQAPDAGFTDLAAKYKDAVNPLKAAGIISGKTATEFKPDDFLTRGEVAIILAKAYKLEAKNQEALPFTDVNKNYAPFVKALVDNKVANGTTATTFGTASDITRGQMAIFLYNAISVNPETPPAPVKVDTVTAIDTKSFKVNFKEALDAKADLAKELKVEVTLADGTKVTPVPTKLTVSEDRKSVVVEHANNDLAGLAGKLSVNGTELTFDYTQAAVKSVSAINAKSLKVTFNKAVDNTKAVFDVKKDAVKSNVSSITWNDAKTEATIALTSKITKGEYVVNVTGLVDGKTLTGSVTTQDEKVSKIEILSESAPLVSATEATVGYKVENQYGEDITKTTSVVVTGSGVKSAETDGKGKITLTATDSAKEFKAGDKVVVTIIHPETATSTYKTITISEGSKVADVTVGTLYNKDNKTLNEDTDLSKDAFYIPVTVKDQYGNAITDAKKLNGANSEVIVTNTNPTAITVGDFEVIKIADKDTVVLPVKAVKDGKVFVGDSTVTVIAKSNAKNSSSTVKVTEATRTDVVNLQSPSGVIAAGEDVYVPISALDKDGKAVTDIKILNDKIKGISVTGGTIVEKDGALFVKVDKGSVKENQAVTVVAMSSTKKVATYTGIAKAAAAPKLVTGTTLTSTSVRPGATLTLGYDKLKIEDQYGRVMSKEVLAAALDAGYSIEATDEGNKSLTLGTVKKITAANYKSASFAVTAATATSTKTSENITFTIVDADGNALKASALDVKFTAVPDNEFASYKVADIDPVYFDGKTDIDDNHAAALDVRAVTKDGGTVKLTAGKDYTVKSTVLTDVNDGVIDGSDAENVEYADKATTATAKLTITINATGEEITKDVTFSNVAPKVNTVEVVENNKAAAYILGTDGKLVSTATFAGGKVFNLQEFLATSDVVVTDQYGYSVALSETGATFGQVKFLENGTAYASTLTLSKVSGDASFASNGTVDAVVNEYSAGSEVNARINVGSVAGNTVKVTNTASYSASQSAVDAEAGKVADFTVVTGTTKVPTLAAGYTIKVKSTSDATVYDADGKALKVGEASVVYTVTNTATGKTADTKAIKVTVTAS